MTRFHAAAIAAAFLTFAACDDATSVDDGAQVTVGFSTAASASSSLNAFSIASAAGVRDVVISGDNGTLTITDVAFIVDEFKLERVDDACEGIVEDDDDDDDDDECEEFETGPAFVSLPLTGAIVPIITETVPAGTFEFLKLETDDIDFDDDDDDENTEIAAVIAAIDAAGFAEWPEDASLVIEGTFTPTEGAARPFTAFFEGEIKVEMNFDPPLVIDGEAGTIDIEIDPTAWFTNLDGSVVDLSAFDFATTGEVVEFEAKMEDGFTRIELEGFDD